MPTLLDYLAAKFPRAKRSTLRRMLADGRVRVNDRVARSAKLDVAESAKVDVTDRPPPVPRERSQRASSSTPFSPPAPVAILHEDRDLLVVSKPPNLLTSTTPREKRPTLLKWVREHIASSDPRAKVGLIHRLDREAAGLLVFSKTDAAYDSLKSQFYFHRVERVYLAVVEGVPQPAEGRIETRLLELPDGRVVKTKLAGKGQRAVLDYRVLETKGKRSLVRVTLQTGRKHQIRSQLSGRGWPIVGDAMYGAQSGEEPLHLCAVRLGFQHPGTGSSMAWEIAPHFAW